MLSKKKQLLFEKQAEIVKAIAHPLRIAVVDFLKDGQQCVCDIAEHIGSERSNVSRHLSVMVNSGVLEYPCLLLGDGCLHFPGGRLLGSER